MKFLFVGSQDCGQLRGQPWYKRVEQSRYLKMIDDSEKGTKMSNTARYETSNSGRTSYRQSK